MSHTTISQPDDCSSLPTGQPASTLLPYSLLSARQPERAFQTARHIMSLFFSKPSNDFCSLFTTKFRVLTLVCKAWEDRRLASSPTQLQLLPPISYHRPLGPSRSSLKQVEKLPPLGFVNVVPSTWNILALDSREAYTSFRSGLSQLSLYQRGLWWLPAKIASCPRLHLSLYHAVVFFFILIVTWPTMYLFLCFSPTSPHHVVSPIRAGTLSCSL